MANLEKMVGSIWYRVFEWFIRLILLNVLMLLAPVIFLLPLLLYIRFPNNVFVIIFAIFGIVSALYSLIVSYVNGFVLIKVYKDNEGKNIFISYFVYLLDTLKKIWLIVLIFVPFILLIIFGIVYYWELMTVSWLGIIGFLLSFLSLIILGMFLVTLAISVAYFQMSFKTAVRFTAHMALTQTHISLVSFLILLVPLLLFMVSFTLPIYFLFGISGPQYIMYLMVHKNYDRMQLELIRKKEEEGENDETRN